MLYHIVLFESLPDSTPEQWDQLREAILDLPTHIAGIHSVNWGPNASPEGIGQGFDHGFVMVFVDAAARDAYLPHPAHLAVIPAIRTVSARTLVYDLAMSTAS